MRAEQADAGQVSLGQLIWLVRRELEWAHQVDADHPLRFDVDSVELDVVVDVAATTKGGGGLDLKVMGVGGSGELSRESTRGSTNKVHVVLTPHGPGGKFEVSALDTEPPPRRAEAPSGEADETAAPGGAVDTEPPLAR